MPLYKACIVLINSWHNFCSALEDHEKCENLDQRIFPHLRHICMYVCMHACMHVCAYVYLRMYV